MRPCHDSQSRYHNGHSAYTFELIFLFLESLLVSTGCGVAEILKQCNATYSCPVAVQQCSPIIVAAHKTNHLGKIPQRPARQMHPDPEVPICTSTRDPYLYPYSCGLQPCHWIPPCVDIVELLSCHVGTLFITAIATAATTIETSYKYCDRDVYVMAFAP